MSDNEPTKPGAMPVTEGTKSAEAKASLQLGKESPQIAQPDAPATEPRGSRRIAWAFLLVVIVIVFIGGFTSAVLLAPRLAGIFPWGGAVDVAAVPDQTEKITAIEAALAATEQRLAELRERSHSPIPVARLPPCSSR